MLALWMYLVLIVVGSFSGGSFPPAGYLRVTPSTTSCILLCRCGQVVSKLVLPCVQGFVDSLLLLFSCLFWVISHHLVIFPDRFWVELVWLLIPPSPSFVVICWWFLCWWVSSSSRYPGVHSFHLLGMAWSPSPWFPQGKASTAAEASEL